MSVEPSESRLEIRTFGRFMVRFESQVLTDETQRSRKLWRLFLYLLRHKDQETPTESIIDYLWDEADIADPRGALSNLIYRLRQLFGGLTCGEPPLTVERSQTGYILHLGERCSYDAEEFVTLTHKASAAARVDSVEAIDLYRKAVSLYQGHYLPGRSYELWVVSASRYYRRVYLETMRALLELLRHPARYSEMIEICDKALSIEFFADNQELHYWYIEALAKQGRADDALNHYEQLSKRLYSRYGREPSRLLQSLHLMLKTRSESLRDETEYLTIGGIRELLVGDDTGEGAYTCTRDVFRYLLRLATRQRRGDSSAKCYIGLCTLQARDQQDPHPAVLSRAMGRLQQILSSNLRQGDVISQWNAAQYLVLLPHCDEYASEMCSLRIQTEFEKALVSTGLSCSVQFETV